MAKKKKPTLKPVARVFATTSQPKKAEPEPEEEAPADEPAAVDGATAGTAPLDGSVPAASAAQDDWEKEVNVEQERLQGYVERLQEKGDKEVNRIVKAIEFDRRMTKGLVNLDLTAELRDEALAMRLEQEDGARAPPARRIDDPSQAQSAKEKALLRLYITHHVLLRLGYPETRVMECLRALGGRLAVLGGDEKVTQGWEEALEWMWLHEEDKAVAAG